ncbi:hypothetical protein ELQ35_02130 [Peribacillus cavernae]|uniref:Uncharacterized protein n=1 Tax=Peribacillus cavernae TaxID=1674310 RepID=A0A3S0W4P0_9BACI|nr:hypothetical protein [Peribacillus cavernae]MDQ0220742.1 hypothetical protein [Peribacillus cavernae]RUQ32451.1 hypothetical protein ELQ35_02130 [Peribacillus cavernae]
MTKNELFTIFELIIVYYDQFEIDQKKVDARHEVLRTCSFEKVKERLLSFVSVSTFPPKVSDLAGSGAAVSRAIPDYQETVVILKTHQKPAANKVIQQELANMRNILGIRRA